MPRPCKCRRIRRRPPVSGFKPTGVPGRQRDVIELGLDELEALRPADFQGLYHDAAAHRMGISRPTFGRLLERARHRVACVLLQQKMLVFQGGPVMVADMRTFECAACANCVEVAHGVGRPKECPKCHSSDFHRVLEERGGRRRGAGASGAAPGQGRCTRWRQRWARSAVESSASNTLNQEESR